MSGSVDNRVYVVDSIERAVEIGTVLTGHWFRGHPKAYCTLLPSLFRPTTLEGVPVPAAITDKARIVEAHIAEGFRLKAPSVERSLPNAEDHLAWLFLMQHHGAPTRLLDWTESVLVSLYFAVRDPIPEDAELWAMSPVALALASGLPALPTNNHVGVQYLAAQAMTGEPEHVATLVGLEIDEAKIGPLPIIPPLSFRRMVGQSSTFTIHPKPRPGNAIPDLLKKPEHLVRYRIPSNKKYHLLNDLASLGISELALFPDLMGLATYLTQELRRPQCQWLPPPHWLEPGAKEAG